MPAPKPSPTKTHTVAKGDNDWTLAKKYGITVKELHALNPGVKWDRLQIGQSLKVPGPKSAPAAAKKPSAAKKPTSAEAKVTPVSFTGETAKVAKSDVLLRKGPGTTYDRVAKLNKGQTAKVIERRSGWTKVRFGTGTTGWLRDDMVVVSGGTSKPDLVAKKEEATLPVTPDTADGSVVSTTNEAASGTAVDPDEVQKADDVVVPPPLKPAIDPREKAFVNAFDGKVARITATNVIVRSAPSTSAARKAMVTQGRTADLLSQQGDWYKVKFSGGTIGWVRNDLMELVSADVVVAEAAKESASTLEADLDKVGKVLATARSKMGTRYVYGASRSNAFDCSGYVVWVMSQHGIKVPRTSAQQATVGKAVAKGSLQKGDLVFFRTTRGKRISHVGIFIGNGQFIHASSGGGKVQVNSLNEGYYSKRYVTARRLPGLAK